MVNRFTKERKDEIVRNAKRMYQEDRAKFNAAEEAVLGFRNAELSLLFISRVPGADVARHACVIASRNIELDILKNVLKRKGVDKLKFFETAVEYRQPGSVSLLFEEDDSLTQIRSKINITEALNIMARGVYAKEMLEYGKKVKAWGLKVDNDALLRWCVKMSHHGGEQEARELAHLLAEPENLSNILEHCMCFKDFEKAQREKGESDNFILQKSVLWEAAIFSIRFIQKHPEVDMAAFYNEVVKSKNPDYIYHMARFFKSNNVNIDALYEAIKSVGDKRDVKRFEIDILDSGDKFGQ